MDRQVPHFREELEALQGRLLEMGGLAEERVRAALQGLVSRDAALINKVLSGDEPINQLHIEVDNRCFRLLALHAQRLAVIGHNTDRRNSYPFICPVLRFSLPRTKISTTKSSSDMCLLWL